MTANLKMKPCAARCRTVLQNATQTVLFTIAHYYHMRERLVEHTLYTVMTRHFGSTIANILTRK